MTRLNIDRCNDHIPRDRGRGRRGRVVAARDAMRELSRVRPYDGQIRGRLGMEEGFESAALGKACV